MTLRLRRGTDAQRLSITPAEGEAIYTTDTKKVYIGDGTTAGGILVTGGGSGGGGLAAVVDDTTPELGGDLDLAGFAVIGSGDIAITGDISARFIQADFNGNIVADDSTIIVNIATSNASFNNVIANNMTVVDQIVAGNVIEAPLFNGSFNGEFTGSVFTDNSTLIIDGTTGIIDTTSGLNYNGLMTIESTREGLTSTVEFINTGEAQEVNYVRTDAGTQSDVRIGSTSFFQVDDTGTTQYGVISGWHSGIYLLASSIGDDVEESYVSFIDGAIVVGGYYPDAKLDVRGDAIITGGLTADLTGSVFADDSTLLVDAVNGTINLENTSIETLLDVNIVSPTTNQVLKYDGANWVNAADAGAASAISINGVTQAATGVVTTDSAHGLYDGQSVTIVDVVGMTELNGNDYYADVLTSATFGLYSDAALTTPVDTSGFTLYDSAGTVTGGAPTNALTLNNQSAAYYLAWTNITSKPTTISGYGISDAVADFADLGATPTTLAGYGISDAVASSSISVFGASLIDDANDTTARTTLGLGTAATTAATDYATAAQGSTADTAVQPAALGNFTFTGSVLDSSDSSSITVTPAVTMSSDLTVENDLRVTNTVYAERFESTSTGTPEIVAAANLDLTAGNAVRITSSVLRLASFTSAERDALAAQNGDVIYNTSLNKFQGYENGAWANLI